MRIRTNGEGMGSIEFLFPEETVNLLRRQDLLSQPRESVLVTGHWWSAFHPLPGNAGFSNTEMHIGVPSSWARRTICSRLGTSPLRHLTPQPMSAGLGLWL